MSLSAGLIIAGSGLANINRQLALLAQNVSNANTPDYVREVSVQTALTAGGVGMGVRAGPATREIDTGLQGELWLQNATLADQQTRQAALRAVDAVQGAPGAGTDLSGELGAVRDAFSNLTTNPADQVTQTAVVTAADTLARTVNAMAGTYASQRQAAQDSMRGDIDDLNRTLADIGALSDQVIRLKAMGQSTADLENQRDADIGQISSLVGVKVMAQANGDVLLATPGGMMLPTRGNPAPFSLADASLSAGNYYPGGGVPGIMLGGVDVTAQFGSGRIGANLALRDTILPGYQAGLDEFASALSVRLANQGLSLFTDPTGAVPLGGGSPTQAGYVGYAGIMQVNAAVLANPALVRDGTQAITASPAGASAFTPNPAGGPAGFSTLINRILDYGFGTEVQSGVPQPPIATTGLGPGGNLSVTFNASGGIADIAAALVSWQSGDAANAKSRVAAETAVAGAVHAKLTAASGVNIDDEMTLMVTLQNTYAANAHVVSAVQAMWDQLLGAVK